MNRFDRVTSLLLLLQTRSVVTARFLSDHFDVSERTIYRDIRTLENAGVPIGAEAGIGYFLEKGYRLPAAQSSHRETTRLVEPIGLFYYSWHWHLIGWCRLREGYRDFRLDRIQSFTPTDETFVRHSRLTLRQYLDEQPGRDELQEVELRFGTEAARFVDEQRYLFGFVDEVREADGVRMRFLTSVPDYMARWLLQYTDDVEVIRGNAIREALERYSAQLAAHWGRSSIHS